MNTIDEQRVQNLLNDSALRQRWIAYFSPGASGYRAEAGRDALIALVALDRLAERAVPSRTPTDHD